MTGIDLPRIDLDPQLDPWAHQPSESTLRYSQFRAYLDPGRGRTLREVAKTLARNDRYVRAVAAAYRWVERAEAWDLHRDRVDELTWMEERRKAAQHDAALLRSALGKVARRLETLTPDELSPADLVRMMDVVIRHRRMLFGDPTSVVAVTGPGGQPDGFAAQVRELASMSPSQRAAAIAELTQSVLLRARAAGAAPDDDE